MLENWMNCSTEFIVRKTLQMYYLKGLLKSGKRRFS